MSVTSFSLDFPFSLGPPRHHMGFRTQIEDFQVMEKLGFDPGGSGEHLFLHIRKRDENTRWVALKLAEFFGVDENAVGYCGLKDRRAVAEQWFSVQLPGRTDVQMPEISGCEIIAAARHSKKLKPGMHAGNQFVICLRGDEQCRAEIDSRLLTIAERGVPNYFGEQRFGRGGNNLVEVEKIVSSRQPRFKGRRGGLYLSAARSWLFNQVLSKHVESGDWLTIADGPLWGRGRSGAEAELVLREQELLEPWQSWCLALEHSGLRQERRSLVLRPDELDWSWHGGDVTLSFCLPPGTFATALLRELALLDAPAMAERE